MGAFDRLLSLTISHVIPRYMTCAKWSVEYLQVIDMRPLSASTKHNRHASTKHIVSGIGHMPIGSVKPIHVGKSINDVIEDCRKYASPGDTLVRRKGGRALCDASLSARFEEAREGAGLEWATGSPPSLHECRSLSERLYREQGVDTRVLLGHKHQSMTDAYNDDRGLSAGKWITLNVS